MNHLAVGRQIHWRLYGILCTITLAIDIQMEDSNENDLWDNQWLQRLSIGFKG